MKIKNYQQTTAHETPHTTTARNFEIPSFFNSHDVISHDTVSRYLLSFTLIIQAADTEKIPAIIRVSSCETALTKQNI